MGKHLIDLDDELLETAQRELGTTGIPETIDAALQSALATATRARDIDRLWRTDGRARLPQERRGIEGDREG
ncbi:DUF2191 domain-containing protein [Nocardia sp. NPDC003482]